MKFDQAFNLLFENEVLSEYHRSSLETFKDVSLNKPEPPPVTELPKFHVLKMASLPPEIQKLVVTRVLSDVMDEMKRRGGTVPYMDYKNLMKKALKTHAQAAMREVGKEPYPYNHFLEDETRFTREMWGYPEYRDLRKLMALFDTLGVVAKNKYGGLVRGTKSAEQVKDTEAANRFHAGRKYLVDYAKFRSMQKMFRVNYEQPELLEVLDSVLRNHDEEVMPGADLLNEIKEQLQEVEREKSLYAAAPEGTATDEEEFPGGGEPSSETEIPMSEPEEAQIQQINIPSLMDFLVRNEVLKSHGRLALSPDTAEEYAKMLHWHDELGDYDKNEDEDMRPYVSARARDRATRQDYETPDIEYET